MTSKAESLFKKSCNDNGHRFFSLERAALLPKIPAAVEEALAARELIKISVLQNCHGRSQTEMAQVAC